MHKVAQSSTDALVGKFVDSQARKVNRFGLGEILHQSLVEEYIRVAGPAAPFPKIGDGLDIQVPVGACLDKVFKGIDPVEHTARIRPCNCDILPDPFQMEPVIFGRDVPDVDHPLVAQTANGPEIRIPTEKDTL